MIAGAILASPYVMFQVWRFIAPGLYADEKRFAIPFVVLSSAGLVAGAAFNHDVLFSAAMAFFASFNRPELKFLPSVDYVFSLYTKMLIGMALTFQMPTIGSSLLTRPSATHQGRVPFRCNREEPSYRNVPRAKPRVQAQNTAVET